MLLCKQTIQHIYTRKASAKTHTAQQKTFSWEEHGYHAKYVPWNPFYNTKSSHVPHFVEDHFIQTSLFTPDV